MKGTFREKDYTASYLDTYVHMGIPVKRYNWLLQKAQKTEGVWPTCKSRSIINSYAWVVAHMPNQVYCSTHLSEDSPKRVEVGSLTDLMNNFKQNVRGYVKLRINVMKMELYGDGKKYFLKFIFSRFLMVDVTKISSEFKPPFSVASPELVEAINKYKSAKKKGK
jgi:hypothetical protein